MKRTVNIRRIALCFLALAVVTECHLYAVPHSDTQQVSFTTNKLRDIAMALPIAINTSDTLFAVSSLSKTSQIKVRRNDALSVTHIGIDLISNQQRNLIGTALSDFVERTLLETLIKSNEQDACLMLKEYNVEMATDGRMAKSPKSWVNELLAFTKSDTPVSINKSDEELSLQWTSPAKHTYGFRLLINREAVEGTKKVEAEEIVYKEISMIPISKRNPKVPPMTALVHNTTTDMLVLPGHSFIQNTVNSETYYFVSKGVPTAVFNKRFMVESIKNLMQGVVDNNKYKLNIRMISYEKNNYNKTLAMKDFVDYWKHKPDFDVFCGVGTVRTNQYEAIVILKNKDLQYIHMLRIPFDESIFNNNEMTLEGNLITNIPSHNIEQLF